MKRVWIYVLLIAALLLFAGCSYFDSPPIKPKILGVTHVVDERGLMYVEIDSVRYPVTSVFSGRTAMYEGKIEIMPVNGMQVTVADFTGQNNEYHGIRFLLGEWTETQIEEHFHRNYTFMFFALGGIFLCVLGMCIACVIEDKRQRKKGTPEIFADTP